MKTPKDHSLSRNATALLRILHSFEEKLANKQITAKNIWNLLLENLAEFEMKGEVALIKGEKKQPIYLSLTSPKGAAQASLGQESIFQQVFENGESLNIANPQPQQGLIGKTSTAIKQIFKVIESTIYSPLAHEGEICGVLAISAEKLASEDVLATEVLCRRLTLVWRTLKDNSIPLGLSEEHPQLYQNFIAANKVYNELFEHSNDAIFVYDLNGINIAVNQQAIDLLGYSEAELLTMSLFDIIFHSYHEECRTTLARLQRGESSQLHKRHFVHKQGFQIPVELNDVAVYSPDGNPLYILSIARDIRERLKTEIALEESEERYHRLVDLAPMGVIITSQETIVYANLTAASLLGVMEPAELIGKSGLAFIFPESDQDAKRWFKEFQNIEEQKNISRVAISRVDEKKIFLDIYAIHITYKSQNAIQFVFSDVTAHIEAEESLEKTAKYIERRAIQLQVAAEIARDAAKEHKLQSLLDKAVNLIKDRFGFYHVGLFLISEDGYYAVLTAATGKAGRKMIAQEHRIQVGKESIVGCVVSTGEAHIALDVGENPAHFENPLLPKTHSEMVIPLKIGDIVIGALDVQSDHATAFDEEDIRVLETMADQLAIAIQNVQLLENAQQSAHQLKVLYETTLITSSTLNAEKILERLSIQVNRLIAPDSLLIGLWDEDSQEIIISAALEDGKEQTNLIGSRFSIEEESLLSWIVEHRKYILVKNLDEEELPAKPKLNGREVLSWLGVPLIIREQLLGVVTVQSFKPSAFNNADRRFLEALANQVAISLENARLFEAESREHQQAQALRQATQVIGSSLSLVDVIETVLEQLAKVLPYDSGCIMLLEEGKLRIKGSRGYDKYAIAPLPEASSNLKQKHLKKIIQNKQIVLLEDTKKMPSWVNTKFGDHIHSWLGVPFFIGEDVTGILSLDREKSDGFTPEEIDLAETFAAQTIIAIENARLFEAAEQKAKELETVLQATLNLTANLRPEEVFDAVLNSVFEYLPDVKDAHVFLYDGSALYFRAFLHIDKNQEGPVAIPRKNGLTYQVARNQEMILVSDMATHPLFADIAPREGWSGAIMGLPLLIGDRTVGVMNIAFQQTREFQQSELRVLKLLSDQVAIAVENARLFEQVAVEQRRLSLLYDMGKRLSTSLDIDTILEQAITLSTNTLGGEVGIASLYNENTKTLKIHGLHGRDITSTEIQKIRELRPGEGLMGWVVENQEAIYVPDVSKDERWAYFEGIDNPRGAAILAPILSGPALLGILFVQSGTEGNFSEEHLDLLKAICQQVGLALSNAQRYQDVNRLVDRLAGEQHRQESLIEGLPIGVLLLDENYQLEVINTRGKEHLEQLSAAKVGDIITHLGPHSLSELIARIEEPLPVDIKLEELPKRVFELQMRSVQDDNQQWIVALQDVTVERAAQERIQMQNRLATVGQLAAGIGHDFNNIMAAILVYTELLLQEQDLPPEFETRLSVIKQQIQRASELIRQILDFSRSSVIEAYQIDLLPFLKELEKLLTRTLPETIRVTLTCESGEYFVNVDPTRLQQVFINLALNARDAMPEGGELYFELTHFHLDEETTSDYQYLPPGNWIRVTVTDTGEGIPENVIPHIYEPFFTTKEIGKGTGLGLAQVYGIIKQFNGYIEVESEEMRGTTFTVFLPIITFSVDDNTDQEEDITLRGTGQKVLLVEDDPPAREALKSMLEMFGYQVKIASNGVEAIEHLQAGEFHFVMSDIVMPEMGGVELYDHIQANWPDLKVMLVTGHPLRGIEKKLLAQEKVVWLQKPFTIQDFSQRMEVFLKDER